MENIVRNMAKPHTYRFGVLCGQHQKQHDVRRG
jgi:hypothetical protein